MKPHSAVNFSILSIGLALAAGSLLAQDTSTAPTPTPAAPSDGSQAAPAPAPEHHRGGRGGFALEDLTQKLTLTADEQKQVGDLIKSSREQMRTLHEDDSMSDEDKRAKMKEIMSGTRSQIRALLTPAQQAIFDTLPTHGPRPPKPAPGAAPGDTPPPPADVPPPNPAPTSPPPSN